VERISWTGAWSKEKTKFTPSKEFLQLKKEDQQLVEFANTLCATPDLVNVIPEFVDMNLDSLPLAQQMIRLKLNGLPE